MNKIGFIGAGIMGQSMIRNLMKAGFVVTVYNRTMEKVLPLVEEGAILAASVAECSTGQDILITIVGYPRDVEEIYFAEEGILCSADEGTIVIDMTTNSPALAVQIYEEATLKGLAALDAPVTGGDVGARNGTLTILAGGDKAVYEKCMPVFEAMGQNITYQGGAGCGQHAKMANQIAIAGTVSGVGEAMAYAKAAGLDAFKCLDAISSGAAGSTQMKLLAPKMLKGDYEPGFYIKHFIKDMIIALEEAHASGLSLDILEKVLKNYQLLAQNGDQDLGTQAIIKHYLDQ